jgi:hypothetical protein
LANRVKPHYGGDVMFRPFDVYNQQCAGQVTIMALMLRYSPLQRPASCTVERAALRPAARCLTRPTLSFCHHHQANLVNKAALRRSFL